MKTIGILTFHASHNYGSMLQNYALQKTIEKIDDSLYPITINLRNDVQDDMYNNFKRFSEFKDKRRYLYKLILTPWKKSLTKKRELFEDFLKHSIHLTKRITSGSEIDSLPYMDVLMVGSDQIWNIRAKDFDKAYYLDFAAENLNVKKIAYAPSMGPHPDISFLNSADKVIYQTLIRKFDVISARETKTSVAIAKLADLKELPEVCPDPTLLLTQNEWLRLIEPSKPIINHEYIFLYNPYYLKDVYDQAKVLSKITGLKVVVSNLHPKTLLASIPFEKHLESGPREFLNLIKNAEYVIGRSFHLAVFSMIFHKKFIAVDGMGDSRLSHFLSSVGMESCATEGNNMRKVFNKIQNSRFDECDQRIARMRSQGFSFLKTALADIIS